MEKRRLRTLLALPALVAPFLMATAAPASAAGCTPIVNLYRDSYGYINAMHHVRCDTWTYSLKIEGYLVRSSTNTWNQSQPVTYKNKSAGTYAGYETRLRNYGGQYCGTTIATVSYGVGKTPQELRMRGCASY